MLLIINALTKLALSDNMPVLHVADGKFFNIQRIVAIHLFGENKNKQPLESASYDPS